MKLYKFRNLLEPGKVYRKSDFQEWASFPYYLSKLVAEGTLIRLIDGVYYCPDKAVSKPVINANKLLQAYLQDDRFLLMPADVYQSLGIGNIQLWETTVVYNHKCRRLIDFGIGGIYDFRVKNVFPAQLDKNFLFVDFINNAGNNDENRAKLFNRIKVAIADIDKASLEYAVKYYGNSSTRRFFADILAVGKHPVPSFLKPSRPGTGMIKKSSISVQTQEENI